MIRLKILASGYKIGSVKKVGINYQIDFEESITLEEVKRFLALDREVKFSVVSVKKLRSSVKNFKNEEKFVEYLLGIFSFSEGGVRKVKLKK
ncbi:MAG: hypothetical protein LBC61_02860 [Candidatus Peribacteria bacterium]|nr:hypothetical protein [Candidatus Peribacteria bacterium]